MESYRQGQGQGQGPGQGLTSLAKMRQQVLGAESKADTRCTSILKQPMTCLLPYNGEKCREWSEGSALEGLAYIQMKNATKLKVWTY